MTSYALDNSAAREGSGRMGGGISETGAYVGVIEWAREKTGDRYQAVEIRFKSEDGQTANFMLFTNPKDDGSTSYGMKQLNALMTCCAVRGINSKPGKVEAYDYQAGQVTEQDSMVFPELTNKKIGLLLQKEFYTYNGEQKYQMNLFAPFTADSKQTAKEVLENRNESGSLQKMADSIKDRYRKEKNNNSVQAETGPQTIKDFDDDIPFAPLRGLI